MGKVLKARGIILVALVSILCAGMLVMAGCSCSSEEPAKSADATYTVPDVVSLKLSDARTAIAASGLQVGTVTQQASDTVPAGSVISQDPKGLTNAKPNSKINLVVSTGKAELKDVVVPDLKGMTQSDAEKALKDVGLVGVASNPEETDAVKPGQVFKQSIEAGKTVKEGTNVAFTVALAPGEVDVPDVTGKTKDEAKKAITDAGLGFDDTTAYNDSVPEGMVIYQSIAAGQKVKKGTTVTVSISLGAKPQDNVTVPDVMTYSWSDAQAAMRSAGLAVRYTGDPAGVVVAQDVAAGTKVAPNTLVTVTLSVPVQYVEVPDLVGKSVSAAENATDALNLALDADGYEGTVIDQWPAAGTSVEEHSVVTVHVKSHETEVFERFLGDWADHGDNPASLKVENIGQGITVKIDWEHGDSGETWEYPVEVSGNKIVCKKIGKKYEAKGSGDPELVYSDGSSEFSINKEGQLIWKDLKDDAGKGKKFDRLLK